MKIPNYISRDVSIHAAVFIAKALQTPRPESPFQVGDTQIKAIRELAKIFDTDTKISNRRVLPTPPILDNKDKY